MTKATCAYDIRRKACCYFLCIPITPIDTLMTDKFGVLRPPRVDIAINAQAQDWWFCLPVAHRPENLALQFPRVMNEVAACWSDPVRSDQYLSSLLVDLKRPQRQGFPSDVGLEILRLYGLRGRLPAGAASK